jgi:hypothetical protein
LSGEKPFVVRFIFSEQQRHLAFARKDQFTKQRMRHRNRTRARNCLDLPEVWGE